MGGSYLPCAKQMSLFSMNYKAWQFFFTCVITIFLVIPPSQEDIVTVTWNATKNTYNVHEEEVDNWIAWANFTDEIVKTGWSHLEVRTKGSYPDEVQAYAAGIAEGYITDDLLYKQWMNTVQGYCTDELIYCDRLKQFIKNNINWMHQQITLSQGLDPYWHQVSLLLNQLAGLEEGYNQRIKIKKLPSLEELRTEFGNLGFLMFQIAGDLEDLEAALNKSGSKKHVLGSGSCSALIKVLPNNADMFVSHVTWNAFQSMLRILKRYNFQFHMTSAEDSPIIPGSKMVFSSYPGPVGSQDDFYLMSSGLVSLETTIGNSNKDLWKYIQPTGIVLEWMRSLIANRLSTDGNTWTKLFLQYNSGTYNNQWMVVDYKKFLPGSSLKDGLLWVAEQIPKYTAREDRTDTLRNQSYWPSYNTPYFPLIFNKSGCNENVKKFGNWFTYDKTPRALIFKRDHSHVNDLKTMIKLMRYNNFTFDPLSRCNCTPPYSAENAISARNDLNPKNGSYPFPALGHRSHGGTDVKVTSSLLFSSGEMVAISGPTHDPLPPFQWSKSDFRESTPHLGHPDLWVFDPVVFGPDGLRPWN